MLNKPTAQNAVNTTDTMTTNDEVAKSLEECASPSFDAMIHVGVWLSVASKRQ